MKKLCLLPVLLLVSQILFSQTFTEQTGISLEGVYNSSVAWGDYDNDGDLDILLTGEISFNTGISKIYKNNGNSTFTEQTGILLAGVFNSSVAWGDYDNDGDLDILLTGQTDASNDISKIYKNNGNNTFTEQTGISLRGVHEGSVAWGDYNNDGFLDILLTGDGISRIYKNEGNSTFTEQTSIWLPWVDSSSVAWGDYDNDGDLDILLAGDGPGSTQIYKNNGNNTFTEQTGISLTEVRDCSIAWGDYDNDGDLDILLTGNKGSWIGISKIYRNDGNDTFTEQTGISLTAVYNSSVAWGDFDNDGYLDILLTGDSGSGNYVFKIYKNNGNNTFTEQTGILLTGKPGMIDVYWGDYDNDGDLDILMTGYKGSGGISIIYKNESGIINTCPASPVCSIPVVNKNSVTLSWEKATDAQTPSAGLNYNLYVKRVSDGTLTLSPMSDESTGFRRIVQCGNMNQTLSYTLQNLDYGEYEWYIQAVDHCFVGSVFSKGQNYTIFIPSAPTKLVANEISINEINLTWIDNSKNETGFVVERSVGNNQNFSVVATVNSNSITYSDKGLNIDTHYYYRIKTKYNNISSEYSNETDVMTSLFVEQTGISLKGVYNSSVAWGDYDNDGDLDILLTGNTGTYTGISKIYKNNSNNTFTEQTGISLRDVADGSVAWGDYDNDGDLDILLIGYDSSYKYFSLIYKNNGNNTFTEQTGISLTGVRDGSIAWGDYDNDGDLDILLTGYIGSDTCISKIYKNDGNNTFSEQTGISLPGVRNGSVAWDDYDNDGDLDILLTGYVDFSNKISKIYKNDGNSVFSEQTEIKLTGVYSSSVAWGDYDNDGDLDILLAGYVNYNTNISKVYRNDGNSSFTEQTGISLTGVMEGSVAWGDYDNDGDLDILLAGYMGSTKIYKNNGNNTFTEQTGISLSGVTNCSTSWGDYDNDGNLDVLLTGDKGSSNYISKIYKNFNNIINTLPSIPDNMKQTVIGNSVTLNWDKATDKETPQNGLSYNLVVQSNDEKIIKSPSSNISNGIRKVVSIGNIGQNNTWTLKDLPNGSYKWSVQAIDHNYAGSKFAPMSTFGVFPVSVIEMTDSKGLVEVYPNPVSQNLSVISADNGASVDYEFVDLLGKVIQKGSFIGKTVIETGSFNPGVYLLKVKNGKTNEIIKIIKE
jgi:predicted nucleotidyltransferase